MTLKDTLAAGLQLGRVWYDDAHRQIERVAAANGWHPVRLAGVLAVTSPQVTVRRNCIYALEWMANSNPLDMMTTSRAALAHYEATLQIRGPKTAAFKACLLGCPDSLVLDTWMGKVYGVSPLQLYRRDTFRRISRSIGRLARQHSLTIAQCQASLWAGAFIAAGREPGLFPLEAVAEEWREYGYRFPLGRILPKGAKG